MPEVSLSEFGVLPRIDGKPGHRLVTPTTQSFIEADGSDVRMKRERVFDQDGNLITTRLISPMGQRYKDNLKGVEDDVEYLKKVEV